MGEEIGRTAAWYFCLDHQRVEADGQQCKAKFLLGPYPSPAEAESALASVHEREERLEQEDRDWAEGPES